MSMFGALQRWLHLKKYQFEVTFAVYMFTPREKFVFYSIAFLLFSMTFIASTLYLPHHISFLCGRAWYYINGEHIDVAASAREVVKDMTSGVLGETAQVPTVVQETVETVVREL